MNGYQWRIQHMNSIILSLTGNRGPILLNLAHIEAVVSIDNQTSINCVGGSYSVNESIEQVLEEISICQRKDYHRQVPIENGK